MGKAGLDAGAKAKGARQPVFRDLPGLCADTPKHTGVAEPQGPGAVDLW